MKLTNFTILALLVLISTAIAGQYEDMIFLKVRSDLKNRTGQEVERIENLKVGEKVTIQHRLYSVDHVLTLPDKEFDKDIVLVLDTSRSMGWGMRCDDCSPTRNEKSRIQIMKDTAKNFVMSFKGKRARISLVSFSNVVYGDLGTYDMSDPSGEQAGKLIARIDALVPISSTNTGAALRQAGQILNSASPTSARFIVLMTDGAPDSINDTVAAASALQGKEYNNYAIGITEVGSNIEDIGVALGAHEVEGGKHYHKALTEQDMQHIYRLILDDIAAILPLTNVHYVENLSGIADVGTVIVVDGNRKPTVDRLKVSRNPDGSTKIEGPLALQLRKNKNGGYALDEKHVYVDIVMNDVGSIQGHTPTVISYIDPFENSKSGVFENNVSIAATDFFLGKFDLMPKKLTVKTNQTGAVSTIFVPTLMRDRRVTWSIEDPTLLNIVSSSDSKLVVKGIKKGTTSIIARHEDTGKEAHCDVEVIPFKLNPKKLFGEEPDNRRSVDKFIVR